MIKKIIIFLLCLLLSACGNGASVQIPESSEKPPSAPVDVESIIEPLEAPEDSEAGEPSSEEPEPEEIEIPEPEESMSLDSMEVIPEEEAYKRDNAPKSPETDTENPDTQDIQEVTDIPAPVAKAGWAEPVLPILEEESGLLPAISPEKGLDCEVVERELLRLVNEERTAVGAEALGIEENMLFAARIRAVEALGSFSHTRPDGTPYNTAFDESGFTYAGKWHGENLSSLNFTSGMLNEKSAAQEMFNSLKGSSGHYRNMVSKNFLQTGMGVAINYTGSDAGMMVDIVAVQLFSSF